MTPRTVLTLVLAAVLATSCSSVAFWKDQFSAPSSPAQPDQPAQPAQPSKALGQTFEEDVQLARTLVERYWQQRFQAAGRSYRPLQKFVAYSGTGGPDCGGQPAVPENAFYCPVGHFIAYDEAWMRGLYEEKGDGAVYVIIPHEIGHAIQAQLMSDFSLNVQRELQADCYAGGALQGLIKDQRLEAENGDDEELLANLAAAGDPTEAWWREDAHGTPAQRQQSFAKGFNQGVDAC
ncbi:neutral zinc metallopeptidase [Sphaerisporangium perillae]|uniref:neutral zinc metallopeptidase n=1 Tax=Sphaerisporangium perillae TaxID=2935860 RepID=UPI002010351A|nr:neutral zinc metallopeptidase [Sphaerisporangium perillae]